MHRSLVQRAKRALERLQANIEKDGDNQIIPVVLTDLADDDYDNDEDDYDTTFTSSNVTNLTNHNNIRKQQWQQRQHTINTPVPPLHHRSQKRCGPMQRRSKKDSAMIKAEKQGWAFRTATSSNSTSVAAPAASATTTTTTTTITTVTVPTTTNVTANIKESNNRHNAARLDTPLPKNPFLQPPRQTPAANINTNRKSMDDARVETYSSCPSLSLDPEVLLSECRLHASGSSRPIAKKISQLKPADAAYILQTMFDAARQTKELFDDIQQLATATSVRKAALLCCSRACTHLGADNATIVQTPPSFAVVTLDTIAARYTDMPQLSLDPTTTLPTTTTTTSATAAPSTKPHYELHRRNNNTIMYIPITAKVQNRYDTLAHHNVSRSWSILLQWSDVGSVADTDAATNLDPQKIEHVCAAASIVGQLHKERHQHRRIPSLVPATKLLKHQIEAKLLHVKAQMIACVDEKSLCRIVNVEGADILDDIDSCHLFLRNDPTSKSIQLRTFAQIGGAKYDVPGIPRAPTLLSSTEESSWWVKGGSIVCHLERTEGNQQFPSVEKIRGGLPIAVIKQGNNNVVRVEDSFNMHQYLSTDPAWGVSPRLSAVLDGDLAAKRMSVMAVPFQDGVVRFARYASSSSTSFSSTKLKSFQDVNTSTAQMFAGTISETLPLVLVAQQSKDSAIAMMSDAKTALAAVGSTRLRHKLMLDGFVSISKASSTMSVCTQVGQVCLQFIKRIFGQDIPLGTTANNTVFTVIQSEAGHREVTDVQHHTTRNMLGARNHTWLHQTAEQCSRLQKPVFYSSLDSRSFPATACFPLFSTARTVYVVCLYVAYGVKDGDDDSMNISDKMMQKMSSNTPLLSGYNFNRRKELNAFFDQIVSFGTDVIETKQETEALRSMITAQQFSRSRKLRNMTKSMQKLSQHTRQYFQGDFEFQPGRNVHLKALCEMVAVQMKADHVQLYTANQDLKPEIALSFQTPAMDLLHIRIPRRKHFVKAAELVSPILVAKVDSIDSTDSTDSTYSAECKAEYLAPGAILAASPICLVGNGMSDSDSCRMWILVERFSGGEFPPYDVDDCAQLVNLTALVFHELSNAAVLDATRVSCVHARCALNVAQQLSGGLDESKETLRSMLLSLHGSMHVDTAGLIVIGKPSDDTAKEITEDESTTTENGDTNRNIDAHQNEDAGEDKDEDKDEVKDKEAGIHGESEVVIGDEDSSMLEIVKKPVETMRSINSDLWLTSICDTQQEVAHPLEGYLSKLDEFSFLQQFFYNIPDMIDKTYKYKRTTEIDKLFDNRTNLEHWFKDHVDTLQISPMLVRGVLAGFVLLIDAGKGNKIDNVTSTNSTAWLMSQRYRTVSRAMMEQIVDQFMLRKVLWEKGKV